MINRDDIMRNSRMSAQVERYHTWPRHNRQSVAEHSFHILRIWWHLWGAPPEAVTEYAIWHDMGEMATGDLPYPVKMRFPALKQITTAIESEHLSRLGVVATCHLEEYQKRRFKICDLLEMLEYGLVEMQMGNRMADPIVHDVAANITELLEDIDDGDRFEIDMYMRKQWNFELKMPEESYEDANTFRP